MIQEVQTDYISHAFWVRTGDIVYDLEWNASTDDPDGEITFDLDKHTYLSNEYSKYEITEIDWSLLEEVVGNLYPEGGTRNVTFTSHFYYPW
ncbi:MAG: hypothetical protein MJZ16_10265 [Bacteroidales bacterium]|nr:hypothetical protein [Bacteroidales bacterium]